MPAIELIAGHTVQVEDDCLGLGDFWDADIQKLVLSAWTILSRIKNPVMVDAGGGVGIVSLLAAVLPDLTCWTFEPNLYDEVVKNVELNGLEDRVHVYPVALLDRPGEMTMYRPARKGRAGLATLASRPGFRPVESFKVPVVRLDDMLAGLERVDLIKLDVEGAELPVLRGAEQLIEMHRPAIMAEVSDKRTQRFGYGSWDIVMFLHRHGYSFSKVTEYDGYFWCRKEHSP
jgi:FkbM family methyltransferase